MALLPPNEAAPGWFESSSRDVENHLTVATQIVYLKFKLRSWPRYGASWLLQFAEDPEQHLARAAQAIEDFPAAPMRLDELCWPQAELVGELGRGARHGSEAFEYRRSSGTKGGFQRCPIGHRG